MWLMWGCLQLPTQYNSCPFSFTVSSILVVLSPVPGLAPAHCLHWMFAQTLGNQGLEVDAVEEGDAAASCTQCNQFHIQGQELLCLLHKSGLAK